MPVIWPIYAVPQLLPWSEGNVKWTKCPKSKISHDQRRNRRIIGLSVAILAGFTIPIGPLVIWHLIMTILKWKARPALVFIIDRLLFYSLGALNPCTCECLPFSEKSRYRWKLLKNVQANLVPKAFLSRGEDRRSSAEKSPGNEVA